MPGPLFDRRDNDKTSNISGKEAAGLRVVTLVHCSMPFRNMTTQTSLPATSKEKHRPNYPVSLTQIMPILYAFTILFVFYMVVCDVLWFQWNRGIKSSSLLLSPANQDLDSSNYDYCAEQKAIPKDSTERARRSLLKVLNERFRNDLERGGEMRILDIGCGDGSNIAAFISVGGVEADGLEPCESYAKEAKEKMRRSAVARIWGKGILEFLTNVQSDYQFALDDVGQYHGIFAFCEGAAHVPRVQLQSILTAAANALLVQGGVMLACVPEKWRTMAEDHVESTQWIFSESQEPESRFPLEVLDVVQKSLEFEGESWDIVILGEKVIDWKGPYLFPPILKYHHEASHHNKRHHARGGGPKARRWSNQPDKFLAMRSDIILHLPLRENDSENAEGSPAGFCSAQLDIANFLQSAFGITAWKKKGSSQWSVRSHPSSGGLQTPEVYVISTDPMLTAKENDDCGAPVWHYNSFLHALQRRGCLPGAVWNAAFGKLAPCWESDDNESITFLVLASLYWRNSWKYGEPGYWKGNLDSGHAIGSAAAAAHLQGHSAVLVEGCNDDFISGILGLPPLSRCRKEFRVNQQHPVALLAIMPDSCGMKESFREQQCMDLIGSMNFVVSEPLLDKKDFVHEMQDADPIASSTKEVAKGYCAAYKQSGESLGGRSQQLESNYVSNYFWEHGEGVSLEQAIFQRRSAKTYDAERSSMDLTSFLDTVNCLYVGCGIAPIFPWKKGPPGVHALFFVHAVKNLTPGLYLLDRSAAPGPKGPSSNLHEALKYALPNKGRSRPIRVSDLENGGEMMDEYATVKDAFYFVTQEFDTRRIAQLLSREQDIAHDGTFTVSFLGNLNHTLLRDHPYWYRYVLWEAGALGHRLYLLAEKFGFRGSGIGSFYGSMVRHFVFGDAGFGSADLPYHPLYHFTVGKHEADSRIQNISPYFHLAQLRGLDHNDTSLITGHLW